MFRIGIDLGGTKIEGILIETDTGSEAPTYREIHRLRVPTEPRKGYEAILEKIETVVGELQTRVTESSYTLGIGTPGSLSPKTGLLKGSNTPELNGKSILVDLEKKLEHPLAIENDANCFAMAEARYGAGKGARLVFGVIMGTGCGGGLVIDGKVWRGKMSIGGEWGHMSIDPNGTPCYCGKRGCVETYISGGGLEKAYEKQFGESKKLSAIFDLYRSGDSGAVTFVDFFLEQYARAMGNLISILDPDVVVLGGGVSNIPEIYTLGYDKVKRYTFTDVLETEIVKNKLGDSAGVIGAALIGC